MTTQETTPSHARLIAASKEKGLPKHEEFTPEVQARRRARADIPFISRYSTCNREATKDGIRRFVKGYGDLNPLYRDPEYASKTRYRGIIAPPMYLYTIQWAVPGAGGRGVHGWWSGGEWEFFRPIFPGDEFKPVSVLRELVEKQGRMGKGKTWVDYREVIYVNHKGEIVGRHYSRGIFAERAKAQEAGKYRQIEKPNWTHDDWVKILDLYDREELRGANPRWWEDVQVGDKLGPMIKGPLSVRDMIAWVMGAGSTYFKAHKEEYEWERRHPRGLEYVEETGDADIPELVHMLSEFARAIGVERPYDYGNQRMTWLGQLFTNWMGDDGFLWKYTGDLRVFNQVGDITTFEGKVTRKYIDNGKCCVDVEAWGKNQRDEYSMPPNPATIILPSKEHGPAIYPYPAARFFDDIKRARPLDELLREGKI